MNPDSIPIRSMLLASGLCAVLAGCDKAERKVLPVPEVVTITLPPPPPPLPPPPKVEPPPLQDPPEQEMIAQEPVAENEPPPEAPAPEPPPADLGTGITGGAGPDMGLGRAGNGGGVGPSSIGRKGGGSRWGHYAGQVQSTVADALRRHPATRRSAFSLRIRVWADASGRVTRARLAAPSGDTALDRAIEDQILTSLQLPGPPPEGMPMPITLRLTARKP